MLGLLTARDKWRQVLADILVFMQDNPSDDDNIARLSVLTDEFYTLKDMLVGTLMWTTKTEGELIEMENTLDQWVNGES
jgi:hypothetical protein